MAEEIRDEWTVKANDAMKVQLVTKAETGPPKIIGSFRPTWTYPIVGDDETIYGYKGLKINLQYNATDMRPHLSHTSQSKVPDAVATADLPEIRDIFEDYLPPGQQLACLRRTSETNCPSSCLRQEARLHRRRSQHPRRLATTRRTDRDVRG